MRQLVRIYRRGSTWWMRGAPSTGIGRRSLWTSDRKVAEAIRVEWEHRLTFRREGIQEKRLEPVRLSDFITRYIDYKLAQGRASETRNAYSAALNNFGETIGRDYLLHNVTLTDIERHIGRRRADGAAPKTLRNEAVILASAFKWALKHQHVRENPAAELELPPRVHYPPRYLRREQYLKLKGKITDEVFRDVLDFYLLSGCRRVEGLDIRISEHVDLELRMLRVPQRKTRDFKTLPISRDLLPVIRRLTVRSKGDKLIPYEHEDTLTKLFAAYVEKAELPPYLTFHTLRHTFGTWLAREGVGFVTIQTLLGHRDAESTKQYVHAYNEDLHAAVKKLRLPTN